MSEVWRIQEKARRVLQADAMGAHGRAGMYIIMDQVMNLANLSAASFPLVAR